MTHFLLENLEDGEAVEVLANSKEEACSYLNWYANHVKIIGEIPSSGIDKKPQLV